jgi:cytochrome c556
VFTRIRLWTGLLALSVGAVALTAANAAGPLPNAAYQKAITADVAALNTLLNGGKPEKGAMPTVKPLALVIAMNAKHAGNDGVSAAAVKVAEAAAKKDWAGAAEIAKTLATATGGKAPSELHKLAKLDLGDVMTPFRLGSKGGLNLEKDIRDAKKAGTADPAKAELVGVRCATLAEYTLLFPTDKAASGANAAKWKKYSDDMLSASKKIVEESAKGAKADGKAIGKLMGALDGSCVACHNDFRD